MHVVKHPGPVKIYLVNATGEHCLVGLGEAVHFPDDDVQGVVLNTGEEPGGYVHELEQAQRVLASMSHSAEFLWEATEEGTRQLQELIAMLEPRPIVYPACPFWPEPEREEWQEHDPARGKHRRGPGRHRPQLLASTEHNRQKQRKARGKAAKRARATHRRK